VTEHFVQNIGCLLAGEDGKENAAAKDRINETGRVTREQPTITATNPNVATNSLII